MLRIGVCFGFLSCLFLVTGCFSRKFFQPAVAPELSPSIEQGSLLTGDWLATYHTAINSGLCADNKTAPINGNCPGGIAYTDYVKGLRNSYIEAIRTKVDANYSNFKVSVYSGNAVFGVSSDWAVIGLGGAGSVIADAGLKSILAAASSGVTGATASYQKQVLNQQSSLAVVAAMDAGRAAQYVVITQSEALDISKYSLENGVSDLRKYYDAGTILGGLLYIQGQMQSQSQASQQQSQNLKTGATPSITTSSLPAGTVSSAYSQTLAATGGASPYTWSISSGSLPAGLSLAAATGVISGTPTAAGTATVTVKVTDSASNTATASLSITVD
jgi:hypothetical protein